MATLYSYLETSHTGLLRSWLSLLHLGHVGGLGLGRLIPRLHFTRSKQYKDDCRHNVDQATHKKHVAPVFNGVLKKNKRRDKLSGVNKN